MKRDKEWTKKRGKRREEHSQKRCIVCGSLCLISSFNEVDLVLSIEMAQWPWLNAVEAVESAFKTTERASEEVGRMSQGAGRYREEKMKKEEKKHPRPVMVSDSLCAPVYV